MELSDKGVSEGRDPLARLYRQILQDLGVTTHRLNELMNAYLHDPKNRIEDNIKSRSTERGNIIQEITRPNMTMKVFLKRLRLLPIRRIEFIARIEWDNRDITDHSTYVNLKEDYIDDDSQSG